MASVDEDYSWSPPSEAELKVIEARRERNNKISSVMGQYLLKGYKMLAITCPICDCILLEDRSKNKFCIGCCEVDDDTKKDNPAVSEEAARKAVEEIQHRQCQDKEFSPVIKAEVKVLNQEKPKSSLPGTTTALVSSSSVPTSAVEPQECSQGTQDSKSLTIHGIDISGDVTTAMFALREKLTWAGNQLSATTSVHEARNIAELISECCKAIGALRDL
ncbi:protein ZNRD2-like [Palaemon carinicauda]|uniref:protein ZNRD2-like n=1 Tax=Palaemon carinicauda TaxID=392227 RepID=UPI0035B5E7BC